jgi:hypothetical protein
MQYMTKALILASIIGVFHAGASTGSLSECEWEGPTADRLLALHLPAGTIAGPIGSALVGYLRSRQVPISFVPADGGEATVRLEVAQDTTVRDVLDAMRDQLPRYQYRAIGRKLVIYPRDEGLDERLDLGKVQRERRGGAYLFVLSALKSKVSALRGLSVTLRGGQIGSGKRPLADEIEVGGVQRVIEHLVSLIQGRPSGAFSIASYGGGHTAYEFAWVDLLSGIEIDAPAKVRIGDSLAITITGTLVDQSRVSLGGPGCGVSYSATPDILEIDDSGRAVARRKGVGAFYAEYEGHSASAKVTVE